MNPPTAQDISRYETELRDRGFQIYCGPSTFAAGNCKPAKHPHTATSRHFLGHAIDVGRDPAKPNPPAESDFERAHLDLLAAEARNRGYRVIWRRGPGDHQDHVHIEIGDPTKSVVNYAKVTGIAIAPGAFPEVGPRRSDSHVPDPPGRVLKLGSTGNAVRVLQKGMNKVFPAYSALTVNGHFQRATEAVVVEFQMRSGLKVDGVAGKDTQRELAVFGITW